MRSLCRYTFTKEALCNLITLMWRGHIDKIAIANPTNSAPYLIVDHIIVTGKQIGRAHV